MKALLFLGRLFFMHLFYVDESGHSADANQTHFVLAGISVFERRCWWITSELDQIAARFDPAHPENVELHGSPMLNGRGIWRSHKAADREQAMIDALSIAASHRDHRVFAAVVKKTAISPRDPVLFSFEQLTSRFDHMLVRKHQQKDTQRGIILFDKSSHEHSLQSLARDFRTVGHTWGVLRNLSEVPVFLDSRASRLIQLADLIAYSIFRKWERNDSRFYDVIKGSFDTHGGVCHGLYVCD